MFKKTERWVCQVCNWEFKSEKEAGAHQADMEKGIKIKCAFNEDNLPVEISVGDILLAHQGGMVADLYILRVVGEFQHRHEILFSSLSRIAAAAVEGGFLKKFKNPRGPEGLGEIPEGILEMPDFGSEDLEDEPGAEDR